MSSVPASGTTLGADVGPSRGNPTTATVATPSAPSASPSDSVNALPPQNAFGMGVSGIVWLAIGAFGLAVAVIVVIGGHRGSTKLH
jgi:hypothetical protein